MELKWKTCIRAGTTVLILYLLIRYWGVCAGMANGVWGCNAVIFGVCCRLCREYSDDISGASCFSKANVSGNGETAPAVLHAARLCVHCLFCGVYRLYDRSRAFKLRKDFDRPASESAGRDLCMDGR